MEIEDIQAFVTVAEAGGMTPAAHRLGVSKPIVSRRLQPLDGRPGFVHERIGAADVVGGVMEVAETLPRRAATLDGIVGLASISTFREDQRFYAREAPAFIGWMLF